MNDKFTTYTAFATKNQQDCAITPAMEDYLEMIYRLSGEHGYTRVGMLAKKLNVKPSSVSKMIKKLKDFSLVTIDFHQSIVLTKVGKDKAIFLLKRHNTIKQFLTFLKVDKVFENTELLEHFFNEDMTSSIMTLLNYFSANQKQALEIENELGKRKI